MWFLRDASGEKVSEFFPSQAKLAMHMQMTPQTLQRAIKKGKNVFQFLGQEVRVVQETIPHFAIFDFPPSENPIETFEWISEVAKWLKVPNQTVYAAVKRGDETKVKNKEGTVFWLKKLEVTLSPQEVPPAPVPAPRKNLSREVVPVTPPVPASRKNLSREVVPVTPPVPAPRKNLSREVVPVTPPVPAPRKNLPVPTPRKNLSREVVPVPAWLQNYPQLAQNLPQVLQLLQVLQQGPPLGQGPPLEQNLFLSLLQQQGQGTSPAVLEKKLFMPPLKHEIPVTPPIPWAVAAVLKEGNKHPFSPPKTFAFTLFVSPKTVAQFIKAGLQGKMFVQGSKTKKIMFWNEKLIYVPDLIKEIIVFYIRSKMFTDETISKFFKNIIEEYTESKLNLFSNPKTRVSCRCVGSLKGLKDEFIHNVVNEFMKLIF